jgi:hypothetical protein
MGEGFNFKELKRAILGMSSATDWDTAKKEWALVGIHEAEEPDTCLCGHFPIIEICEIYNRITKNRTEVGNVCVKKFLGIRSDLIFTALKRIRRDTTKSLNEDAAVFFKERGVLNDWEYRFVQDRMRTRLLSSAQMATRVKINTKVLEALKQRGFKGPDKTCCPPTYALTRFCHPSPSKIQALSSLPLR